MKWNKSLTMFLRIKFLQLLVLKIIFGFQHCNCDKISKVYTRIRRFDDSVISKLSIWSLAVKSKLDCGMKCTGDKQCVSFFYNTKSNDCTGHAVQFYSTEPSIEEEGSLYFTQPVDKRLCAEVLNNDPESPDGLYIINPDDGIGPARVYCNMSTGGDGWTVVRDCAEIQTYAPNTTSGIFIVNPADGLGHFRVYCDMTTDGGGWTVFQRRQDGSVDFFKYWADYKTGFGRVDAEFWLGNDNINRLTSQGSYKLRIDMKDHEHQSGYATYSTFHVESEAHNYRLKAKGYKGDRGNSLVGHNGMMFSTRLHDHDICKCNCAFVHRSAGWFYDCVDSNLNGVYGETKEYGDGITWGTWHGKHYSLMWVEMKMKPR